jgi:hypothetical protein
MYMTSIRAIIFVIGERISSDLSVICSLKVDGSHIRRVCMVDGVKIIFFAKLLL